MDIYYIHSTVSSLFLGPDQNSMALCGTIISKNIVSVIDRIKPGKFIEVHENFYKDRKELYKKFKDDKRGWIYVIVNKLNGKCYVGSSKSLQSRLRNYFNLAHLAAQKNRPLSHAIIKYGLVNFAFIIVEEVDMTVNNLEDRETYWIKHILYFPQPVTC